jgi:hypothetical protein
MNDRKRLSLSKDTLRALGETALLSAVGGAHAYDGGERSYDQATDVTCYSTCLNSCISTDCTGTRCP